MINKVYLDGGEVYLGDCLEIMPSIPDKSIDMILCDLPYGTTACKWDTIIPFEPLWKEYKRLIKDNGAIVLTASQPFTSNLVMSNIKMFKYEWIWEKTKAGNFINANNSPLKLHENICVFSKGTCANHSANRMTYFPQGVQNVDKQWSRPQKYNSEHNYTRPSHKLQRTIKLSHFPSSVISINSEHNPPHPTQKPVALFEYLIKTYTNEGDLVLDNCIGSGTTAIACININRNYIGCELDKDYYNICIKRIQEHQRRLV